MTSKCVESDAKLNELLIIWRKNQKRGVPEKFVIAFLLIIVKINFKISPEQGLRALLKKLNLCPVNQYKKLTL